MAFVLSEEQNMLRDMAKQFFSEQVPVKNLRQLRDDGSEIGFDRDVWKQIVELGFASCIIADNFFDVATFAFLRLSSTTLNNQWLLSRNGNQHRNRHVFKTQGATQRLPGSLRSQSNSLTLTH